MQLKRFFLIVVLLFGSWLVWTSGLAAQTEEDGPVNVGLLYFTAAIQADGVRLDWGTATELDTAGFIIQRSPDGTNFTTLNGIGFISSTGGVATGAAYSAVDTTAVTGQTYTYKLVEVETNSNQNDLETATIFFNPQPTATSIVIGNPTPRPSNTPAPAATATKQPTATATSTAVSTQISSQPTATPSSLATTSSQPTATSDNFNTLASSPGTTSLLQPTAAFQADQPFSDERASSNGSSVGIVQAQEQPTTEAYPASDSPAVDTTNSDPSYPAGQEPPAEFSPEYPTPYPAGAETNIVPTLAVIGSSNPYPLETNGAVPSASPETIRSRILLWAGFLIALFIFLSGIVGAIVLYRRRPS